jgi:hypothetical protein
LNPTITLSEMKVTIAPALASHATSAMVRRAARARDAAIEPRGITLGECAERRANQ